MNKTNSQAKIKGKSGESNDSPSDTGKGKPTNVPLLLLPDEENGVSGTNSLKVPKASLLPSSSHNEAIGKHRGSSELKKTPSLIPRLKPRKSNQTDRDQSKKSNLNLDLLTVQKVGSDISTEDKRSTPPKEEAAKAEKVSDDLPSPSTSEVQNDCRDRESPEPQNVQNKCCEPTPEPEAKTSVVKSNSTERENKTDSATDPREVESQEIALQYLYETIKYTPGPLFEKPRWNFKEKPENSKRSDSSKSPMNVQLKYEYTLQEISEIWKNTITLIRSVKDHTIDFVERGNQSIDREQIILETEMMQLAVDFAINYSKLKSDFFLKWLHHYLNVEKPIEKSDLENFMDSKTCAALYNSDDLDAMARTVADLTASVLKGEDFALK